MTEKQNHELFFYICQFHVIFNKNAMLGVQLTIFEFTCTKGTQWVLTLFDLLPQVHYAGATRRTRSPDSPTTCS